MADGLHLQQVLINLVSNAIKFTNAGEIELSLQLIHSNSQTNNTFRFSVRDTGIGFSTKNKSKIYESFTQEDFSTIRKYGGTGLGLSISNGILAMMDSNLELESTRFSSQENYKSIPIIGITAGIMRNEKAKCLEAGMDDFITKPILDEIFISLIMKWVLH